MSGSTWIDEATGVRTNNEFNKTVFGNWVEVKPGETVSVTISYTLPFKLDITKPLTQSARYSLVVQKQPGALPPIVISTLHYPADYNVAWSYPTASATQPGQYQLLNTVLQTDTVAGVVLAK